MEQAIGLLPQLEAELTAVRQFVKDDGRVLPAFFAGDPTNTRIGFASGQPDRSFGNLALGISAVRPGGWQWFASVDRSLGNSILRETRFTAGFRKAF